MKLYIKNGSTDFKIVFCVKSIKKTNSLILKFARKQTKLFPTTDFFFIEFEMCKMHFYTLFHVVPHIKPIWRNNQVFRKIFIIGIVYTYSSSKFNGDPLSNFGNTAITESGILGKIENLK